MQGHFLVYPSRHGKRPEVEAFCRWVLDRASATARDMTAR
jgi:hypothetical protein